MTIDEAIKHAEEVADLCEYEAGKYDMSDSYESHVACQEGKCAKEHRQLAEWLKELKQLREQEPCDNAISKQAVLELVADYDLSMGQVVKGIHALPPVTPQPQTGRWSRELIRNEHGGCIGAKMICSECGQDNGYDKRMKFCPNCGAKMVETQKVR